MSTFPSLIHRLGEGVLIVEDPATPHLVEALSRVSESMELVVAEEAKPTENMFCFNCDYLSSFHRAMIDAENAATFWEFVIRDDPPIEVVNPLPILARAVNAVRLCHRIIFQPCWRAERWKSRT